ncbi:hypothetical protein LY90DRAFT_677221 [Neocallimastix californiae]|uniref:Uncharacterized protein n=1 Tax=Neocallimastix californiae TaxID=1754190 RepID=A0A1Y2A710_9FUNG|nr:hypothetical protein LY90DRAFT_677221 [Neocallimastix californiae]|eukprot:ORY18283.1 hypothetical protein LY90DRAFT_677221 [Neocallimastix californiae]
MDTLKCIITCIENKKNPEKCLMRITQNELQNVFELLNKQIKNKESLEFNRNILKSIILIRKNILTYYIDNKRINNLEILVRYGLLSNAEILYFFEEILLFSNITFRDKQYLNYKKSEETTPDITLLRNLKCEIYNQILKFPSYICIILNYREDGAEFIKSLSYLGTLVTFIAIQKFSSYLLVLWKQRNYKLIKYQNENSEEGTEGYKKRKLDSIQLIDKIKDYRCCYLDIDFKFFENENVTECIINEYLICIFFQIIPISTLEELLTLKQIKYTDKSFFFIKFLTKDNKDIFQFNPNFPIEEERWSIIFNNEFYKHFICILDCKKEELNSSVKIKNLFQYFFSYNIIYPVYLQTNHDYEIIVHYFHELNDFILNYGETFLELTLIESNPIKCNDDLLNTILLIDLLNNKPYFSNHAINLFFYLHEHQNFLNYLSNNYFYIFQIFIKLIFVRLSRELYYKDYENMKIEFQILFNTKSIIEKKIDYIEEEREGIIIINDSSIDKPILLNEEETEKEKENQGVMIKGLDNSNGDKGEKEKEEETYSQNYECSKIMNKFVKLLRKINQIPLYLEYNNLYLYPTFIKSFSFINITKHYAKSFFLSLDENYFNQLKVFNNDRRCPIDFLLLWLKNSFGITYEFNTDNQKLEYIINNSHIKKYYKNIINHFKSVYQQDINNYNNSYNNKNYELKKELEVDYENKLLLKIHCIALFMKDILIESQNYLIDPNYSNQRKPMYHRHKYKVYDGGEDLLQLTFSLSSSFNQEEENKKVFNPNSTEENVNNFSSIEEIIKQLKEIDSLVDVDELKNFSLSTEVIIFVENYISPFLSMELRNSQQTFKPYQNFIRKYPNLFLRIIHTIKIVMHDYFTDKEILEENKDNFSFPKEFITQLINISNTLWFYKVFFENFIMMNNEQSKQLLDRINVLLNGSASQENVAKKLLHIFPLWLFCLTKLAYDETKLIIHDFIDLLVNADKTQIIVSQSKVETMQLLKLLIITSDNPIHNSSFLRNEQIQTFVVRSVLFILTKFLRYQSEEYNCLFDILQFKIDNNEINSDKIFYNIKKCKLPQIFQVFTNYELLNINYRIQFFMIPFIETFLEIFISFVESPKLEKKLLEWFLYPFVNLYYFNRNDIIKRIIKYQNESKLKTINNRIIFKNVIELCIQNVNKYIDIIVPYDDNKNFTLFNGLVRIGIVQIINNIENGSQYFHKIATLFEDEVSFKRLFQKIIPENKFFFEEDIDILLKILTHKSNSVLNKKSLINSILHLISSFSCFNSIIQIIASYPIFKCFNNILNNVSFISFEDFPYSIPQNILIICSMIIQFSSRKQWKMLNNFNQNHSNNDKDKANNINNKLENDKEKETKDRNSNLMEIGDNKKNIIHENSKKEIIEINDEQEETHNVTKQNNINKSSNIKETTSSSLSTSEEKDNQKEKEVELLNNIIKYFSIIESSLDTLYLFSVHLKEESPSKDIKNNTNSSFNPKIIKRIVNFSSQSKASSNNNNDENKFISLKFAQILEKIITIEQFTSYLLENPKLMLIICKILKLCFTEFSFIKDCEKTIIFTKLFRIISQLFKDHIFQPYNYLVNEICHIVDFILRRSFIISKKLKKDNIHVLLNHYERNIGGNDHLKETVKNLDNLIN